MGLYGEGGKIVTVWDCMRKKGKDVTVWDCMRKKGKDVTVWDFMGKVGKDWYTDTDSFYTFSHSRKTIEF